jgi:hypothetical protein
LIRESRLYLPVARYLQQKYVIRREVKVGSKIVDVLGLSKTGEGTVAVELKVDKWQRAMRQAATYQIFVDRSYVALHRSKIAPALKHRMLFEDLGIGLMSVKRNVVIHVEALPSAYVDKNYESKLRLQT